MDVEILINAYCHRSKEMSMDVFSHPLEGSYPVIYPDLIDIIFSKIEPKKIMVNVAFLNKSQKKDDIHNVMNFQKHVFLDCGIFQRGLYKREFAWNEISRYRDRLINWYSTLKPDIASSLDLPCPFQSERKIKLKRLQWSIRNYIMMKKNLDIPLFLGISCFSKNDVIKAKKLMEQNLEKAPELLGLGGMVPLMRSSETQLRFGKIILKIVHFVRKNFPCALIHVYGLGDHRWYPLIRLLGASSSDYASYTYISGRGQILLPGLPGRYIFRKIKLTTKKGISYYTRPLDKLFAIDDLKKLGRCCCPICKSINPSRLEYNREYRLIHNMYVILTECELVDEFLSSNNLKGLKQHIKELYTERDDPMRPLAHYASKLLNKNSS